MNPRLALPRLCRAVALLLVAGLFAASAPAAAGFVGQELPAAEERSFSLPDTQGQRRGPADFRGKAVLMFFGFTSCPDICPTELARMAEVMSLLGDDASRVQVLFITLDPERDTPELLAEYMNAFDSRFIALRGSDREIAEAARAYRVFYRRIEGSQPGRYTLEHSAYVFALDPQGRLRLRFTGALAPGEIVTDVRHLLDGH